MATSRTSNTNNKKAWYEDPVKKVFAILVGFGTIGSAGYTLGSYFANQESKIEKIQWEQECNEKVNNYINMCREKQMDEETKKMQDLQTTIKEITKQLDEKK